MAEALTFVFVALLAGSGAPLLSHGTTGDLATRECSRAPGIVTSELKVQVYFVASIGGELEPGADREVIVFGNGVDRSARTDRQGFVEFRDLRVGDYTLHVPTGMLEPSYQVVHIRPMRSEVPRTIAVIANVTCGRACAVDGTDGALTKAPACLYLPRPK